MEKVCSVNLADLHVKTSSLLIALLIHSGIVLNPPSKSLQLNPRQAHGKIFTTEISTVTLAYKYMTLRGEKKKRIIHAEEDALNAATFPLAHA